MIKRGILSLLTALLISSAAAETINVTPSGGGGGGITTITINSTTTTGGTDGRVLFDNAGTVGEKTVTGTGSAVLQTAPSLITPNLGVASATTINKVTITAPATGSTLTVADGKTLTASNTLAFTGTDSSSVNFGAGGTVLYTNQLGTGVATALGVNVGSAGAFVTNGGALGTPSSGVATNLTGTASGLTAGNVTTNANLTGPVTSVGNATTITANAVTLAMLATQATNTVLGNATSGTAVPTALAVGTCSTAASALIWTTNTGFGCNTSITANAVPAANLTGTTLASGVTASSLISLGVLSTGLTFASGATVITNGSLMLRDTTTNNRTVFRVSPNGTVASTPGAYEFYGTDFQADQTNYERLVFFARGSSDSNYLIATQKGGTGTVRPLQVTTGANTGLVILADGTASYASDFTLSAQTFAPSITTTSAAQTGTVCWTTGTGKFTVDTTAGCLTSLEEAKNVVAELQPADALKLVAQLEPFSFRYRPGWGDSGRYEQFGLGARKTALVDERFVGRDPEGSLQGVRYQELTAVLAGAIKQLKADAESIHAELNIGKTK